MGILDSYRDLPPWRLILYTVCVVAALGLVIWDFVDESAQYTSLGVLVLLVIAIAVRPGGIRGPRRR